MTVEEQLQQMKKAIDNARNVRYRAEAKLEELEKQKQRLLIELEELGVKPEDLDQEIERLDHEIQTSLQETWQLIPKELISDEK